MENSKNYSPYYEVEGVGGSFGLCFCKRCGCAVMIDKDNAPKIHDEWHKKIELKLKK